MVGTGAMDEQGGLPSPSECGLPPELFGDCRCLFWPRLECFGHHLAQVAILVLPGMDFLKGKMMEERK